MKNIFSSLLNWFRKPCMTLSINEELVLLRSKVAIDTAEIHRQLKFISEEQNKFAFARENTIPHTRRLVELLTDRVTLLEKKTKPITAPKKKVSKSVRRVK